MGAPAPRNTPLCRHLLCFGLPSGAQAARRLARLDGPVRAVRRASRPCRLAKRAQSAAAAACSPSVGCWRRRLWPRRAARRQHGAAGGGGSDGRVSQAAGRAGDELAGGRCALREDPRGRRCRTARSKRRPPLLFCLSRRPMPTPCLAVHPKKNTLAVALAAGLIGAAVPANWQEQRAAIVQAHWPPLKKRQHAAPVQWAIHVPVGGAGLWPLC